MIDLPKKIDETGQPLIPKYFGVEGIVGDPWVQEAGEAALQLSGPAVEVVRHAVLNQNGVSGLTIPQGAMSLSEMRKLVEDGVATGTSITRRHAPSPAEVILDPKNVQQVTGALRTAGVVVSSVVSAADKVAVRARSPLAQVQPPAHRELAAAASELQHLIAPDEPADDHEVFYRRSTDGVVTRHERSTLPDGACHFF